VPVSATTSFTARASSSRRGGAIAALALLVVTTALWAPRIAGSLDLRFDAGVYWVLGTALAGGHGYRLLNEPGAIEAIQYPPLLPLFVAAHERVLGSTDPLVTGHALRWSYAALFAAYLLAVLAFARRRLSDGWALVASLLVALQLQLVWLSDLLFAELPFALVTMLFLLAAERGGRRIVSGVLAGACYLLRSAGVAVLAAWVADGLLRRGVREAALRSALALVPVLGWQLHVSHVQHGPEYRQPAYAYQRAPYQYYNVGYLENMSYVDSFAPERGRASALELARRVSDNVARLPVALGASVSVDAGWLRGALTEANERWLPRRVPPGLAEVLLAILGAAAVAGQLLLAVRGERLVPFAWLATLGLIVLTPWELQFGRYLMPIASLTAVGLVALLATFTRALSRLVRAGVGAVLVSQALVLAMVFARQHPHVTTADQRLNQWLFFYGDAWAEQDRAIAWLGANAEPEAIVATSTPFRVHIATGRRAVLPPFEADVTEEERLLDGVPIAYLVVDDLDFVDVTRRYAQPVVTAFPERWQLVHGNATSGSRIYRRVHAE
jgi:hypothetical protein